MKKKQKEFEKISVDSLYDVQSLNLNDKQKIQAQFENLRKKWKSILHLLYNRHSKIESFIENYKSIENELTDIETWFREREELKKENELRIINNEIDSLQESLEQSKVSI